VWPDDISDALCERVSALVAASLGLDFPPDRYADLRRGLIASARELGLTDVAQYAQWLVNAGPLPPDQLDVLASHLTVGETYFFRERLTLGALAEHALSELIRVRRRQDKRLRIWSAACSSGEEVYSLAILLQQILPDWREWHITILGTDINQEALRKAQAGVYTRWSFRNCPPNFQEKHFTRLAEDRFEVRHDTRALVRFEHMNLATDVFPSLETDTSAMDVILCRNLLIYFTPAQAQVLVGKLHRSLVDEGWLAVGPSECSQHLFSHFATVNYPNVILYRKTTSADLAVPTLAPADGVRADDALASTASMRRLAALNMPTGDTVELRALRDKAAAASSPAIEAPLVAANDSEVADAKDTAEKLAQNTRTLANEGRLTEARALSERLVRANKLDPTAHYLHATITQELGDDQAARKSLQRSIFLQPDFALGHFALGTLARRESRHSDAKRHFENALRVLRNQPPEEVLPESDGMTASQLADLVAALLTVPTQQVARPNEFH
jgi:chemotaxis protein methyltransferase CheR